MEAIWWETQDLDVNKNRIGNPTLHVLLRCEDSETGNRGITHHKEITRGLSLDTIKDEMIKEIVEVLEEGYIEVKKDLWNN